jgi:hypothetical protein
MTSDDGNTMTMEMISQKIMSQEGGTGNISENEFQQAINLVMRISMMNEEMMQV